MERSPLAQIEEGFRSNAFSPRRTKLHTTIQTTWRKYVSGLFYCSGKKKQFYAVTIETNSLSREHFLMQKLEDEFSGLCSDMRYNYGYSSQTGDYDGPIYPEVEIGEL